MYQVQQQTRGEKVAVYAKYHKKELIDMLINCNELLEKAASLAEPNFYDNKGKPYLVRCPKCHRENYIPAVSTGTCVWCGYKVADKPRGKNAKV